MKTLNSFVSTKSLIAASVASILLAACATAPIAPAGAAEARARLTRLQSDPDLSTRASASMQDAETAVRAAEEPQTDPEIANYRVYMAERKIDIATARAKTSLAEDQHVQLSQQRDKSRLDSRTREADAAHLVAADATAQSAELQRQLDELNAKNTDRGTVLTLGDVLFETGKADLKIGATSKLNKLAAFLAAYPNRTVAIEGYTDSVGSSAFNDALSQRRADSVKSYLTSQGVSSTRLTTAGKGESDPIAGNDSAAGRQQNRRVEVIIANPPVASR